MSKVHGIVYAYHSSPRLGDLTRYRTNASLPFCGRYRLIDFALSSLSNAGVHSVGVIMQRDYQSLLDHLGSGKAWDLSRRSGGLHLLPPFGVNTRGDYTGTAEALNAVISYVRSIPESEIVLMPADIVCNLDLAAAIAQHDASGCGITAICRGGAVTGEHHRYLTDAHGRVTKLITSAAAGRTRLTPAASFQWMENMIASAPNMKITVQTASITCQDTSDEMRSVSLITREWMYPTLFRLKNENDSV